MKVNILRILSFAFVGLFCCSAIAKDMLGCLAFNEIRGDKCGDPTSLRVDVTNTCNVPIYVKMCRELAGGKWECGSNSSMRPGYTDVGFWSCKATGRKRWAACTGGYQECGFDPNGE